MASDLGKLKFSGIPIPYQEVKLIGAGRDFDHEYWSIPGSNPEKGGRKAYQVSVKARFDRNIRSETFRKAYPQGIFPNGIGVLMAMFEGQETHELEVPGVGKFPAFCANWTVSIRVAALSGADVELIFKEDQEAASLVLEIPTAPFADLPGKLSAFEMTMGAKPPGIFEQIRDAINKVLSIRDQANMWSGLVLSKIEAVRQLFVEADKMVDDLKGAKNLELIEAFQSLWESITDLAENITGMGKMLEFVVPSDASAQEISRMIWGDTKHTNDIIQLNIIEDPDLIKAGTLLKYFK